MLNGKIYAFAGISGFLLGDRGTYYASMDIYTPAQAPGAQPLGAITRTASGTIEIALPEGETYDIEYSADLTPDSWIVVQPRVSGSYEDSDPSCTHSDRGFYRGVR